MCSISHRRSGNRFEIIGSHALIRQASVADDGGVDALEMTDATVACAEVSNDDMGSHFLWRETEKWST